MNILFISVDDWLLSIIGSKALFGWDDLSELSDRK